MKKITVLTAYDFNTARALEEAGIDYILVGDSLGMVALGHPNTHRVNLGEMLIATRACRKGAKQTQIITDLPLAVINKELPDILKAAQQIIKAGANIIKIENADKHSLKIIDTLMAENINIMGHLGYTPQSSAKPMVMRDYEKLLTEALLLEEHGVMGIVLEMVPSELAKNITQALKIPTIGIGAGPFTSGQVLVSDDMLGRYTLFEPKFVRKYANQYSEMTSAFKSYINDVENSSFPNSEESFD